MFFLLFPHPLHGILFSLDSQTYSTTIYYRCSHPDLLPVVIQPGSGAGFVIVSYLPDQGLSLSFSSWA